MKKFTVILSVIGAALSAFAPRAQAQPYGFSQVIVFGDSNVDSGYYKALSNPGGSTTYNNDWASAVAHGAGAPTTNPGAMNVQALAAFFGLTANPANTAGGTNYATSGAKNETTNNSTNGGFTAAIPTGTQIRNYVAAHTGAADSQALYLIWSGDNDVSFANGDTGAGPYPSDPNAYLSEAAEDLNGDILFLKNAGAQYIIVAGLAYDYPTGSSTDAVNHRALKLFYTQTLFQNLTQIGVPYFAANTDQVRLAISANPSKYGFTNVGTGSGQMACTEPSGVTSAWALLCSSDPAAPSTYVSASAPQTDLFADDQHLGTAGQKLMANMLYRLVVPATVTHNFDTDGRSDIAWRQSGGATALWLMNGATSSQSAAFGVVPGNWQIVGQRDFNGDGRADWLWRDSSSNTVAIWLMNGVQAPTTGNIAVVPANWVIAGTGDFNADGNGDLLWRDNTAGTVAIWLMNGLRATQTGSLGAVANNWVIAGTGDFDGDGNSDILWRDNNSGTVGVWLLNGLAVAQSGSPGAVAANWHILGTGDFNGDGKTDILWQDSNTGTVAIWLMNGTQMSQSGSLGVVPGNWSVAETGDFGDGKSDVLWRDTTAGTVAMWFMNGLQVKSTANVGVIGTDWTIQGLNAD